MRASKEDVNLAHKWSLNRAHSRTYMHIAAQALTLKGTCVLNAKGAVRAQARKQSRFSRVVRPHARSCLTSLTLERETLVFDPLGASLADPKKCLPEMEDAKETGVVLQ